jgi:hypothetical protein
MMEQITACRIMPRRTTSPSPPTKAEIDTEMQSVRHQRHQQQELFLHQELPQRPVRTRLQRRAGERRAGAHALASKAYTTVSDSYKFTDAELEKEYQANKDSFDTFDYTYYLVRSQR